MATRNVVAVKVAAVLAQLPIGPAIDTLAELRDKKRKLEAQIKDIETEYAELEQKLMDRLDAEGTSKGAGKNASASITETVVGNLVDFEAFAEFARKKNYMHLFQRRLSDPAIRELFDKGVKIPGVEPFTKRRLNLRSGA